MKIIKNNRKKGDCGVVAAFNAASWCNVYKSYKEIEKIAKSCGYNPDGGIYSFQFANLMKKLSIPAKKIHPRSMKEIESKLYLGKLFVFLYTPTGLRCGHAVTIFTDHKGIIRIINPDDERITWNELASDIHANGMMSFNVYEVPCRLNTKNDDARSS